MSEASLTLRASTQRAHQALEATRLAQDLMSPALTLLRYRDIVQVWAGAWVGLELALQASVGAQMSGTLMPLPRSEWAVQDLAELNERLHRMPVNQVGLAQLAGPELRLAPAASTAELLGLCYVAQGALLGGKVIARHVQATLQLPEGCATRFFAPSPGPVLSWAAWTRAFNQRIDTSADLAEAVHGALRTFAYLHQAFDSTDGAAEAADQDQAMERAA